MDVTSFEQFQRWTEADGKATVDEKKAALQMFCEFHAVDPHQLVAEAQSAEGTAKGLRGLIAPQRIRQFYTHLTKPEDAGGLGYDREAAQACYRRVRSFYTKYGVGTKIEAIASWEAGTSLRSLRTASFESWKWED